MSLYLLFVVGAGYALGSLFDWVTDDSPTEEAPVVSDPLPEPDPDNDLLGTPGNDLITGEASDVEVKGLDGDDVMDARSLVSSEFFGGAGDDRILIDGFDADGAGYVNQTDGGRGDDTIVFDDAAEWLGFLQPQLINGGFG